MILKVCAFMGISLLSATALSHTLKFCLRPDMFAGGRVVSAEMTYLEDNKVSLITTDDRGRTKSFDLMIIKISDEGVAARKAELKKMIAEEREAVDRELSNLNILSKALVFFPKLLSDGRINGILEFSNRVQAQYDLEGAALVSDLGPKWGKALTFADGSFLDEITCYQQQSSVD